MRRRLAKLAAVCACAFTPSRNSNGFPVGRYASAGIVTQVQNGCIPVVARIADIAAEQTCRPTHELQADFCHIERAAGDRRLCTSWLVGLTLGTRPRHGSSGVAVLGVTDTTPEG